MVAQREQAALVVEADFDSWTCVRSWVAVSMCSRRSSSQRTGRPKRIASSGTSTSRVDDQLGAEAAADVGSDHAHAVQFEPEQLADELSNLMGACVDAHTVSSPATRCTRRRVHARLYRLAAGAADRQAHRARRGAAASAIAVSRAKVSRGPRDCRECRREPGRAATACHDTSISPRASSAV
jgi:hypothetical protein